MYVVCTCTKIHALMESICSATGFESSLHVTTAKSGFGGGGVIQGSKIVANESNLHEINIVNSKSIGILNIHVIHGSLQYIGPSGADPDIYVRI